MRVCVCLCVLITRHHGGRSKAWVESGVEGFYDSYGKYINPTFGRWGSVIERFAGFGIGIIFGGRKPDQMFVFCGARKGRNCTAISGPLRARVAVTLFEVSEPLRCGVDVAWNVRARNGDTQWSHVHRVSV